MLSNIQRRVLSSILNDTHMLLLLLLLLLLQLLLLLLLLLLLILYQTSANVISSEKKLETQEKFSSIIKKLLLIVFFFFHFFEFPHISVQKACCNYKCRNENGLKWIVPVKSFNLVEPFFKVEAESNREAVFKPFFIAFFQDSFHFG